MDFEHSESRRMLASAIARFVRERSAPIPAPTAGRPAVTHDAHDARLWRDFGELGVIAALFREEDGGLGGSGHDIAVVFEELGRGLVRAPFLASAMLAGRAIALAGQVRHRQLLSELMAGQGVAAFAHVEPGTHYELEAVHTSATPQGDGWRLDGCKAVVHHAEVAQCFVVTARVRSVQCKAAGADGGLSMFLVPASAAGLSRRAYPLIDGGHAAELRLDGVRLGPEGLLAGTDRALPLLERVVAGGVLALSAEALGLMDVLKDSTLEYLRTRRQFGVPIGSFQALQHRMADLLLEIEQTRSAVINASVAFDGDDRIARERALSAAKYTVGRVGTLVAEEAIQMHGGIGMTWELPLSHFAKRLVMLNHEWGDEDHHLERYIALGRGEPLAAA